MAAKKNIGKITINGIIKITRYWVFEYISISQTNIYLYKSTQAQCGLLKFEVWILKSEI